MSFDLWLLRAFKGEMDPLVRWNVLAMTESDQGTDIHTRKHTRLGCCWSGQTSLIRIPWFFYFFFLNNFPLCFGRIWVQESSFKSFISSHLKFLHLLIWDELHFQEILSCFPKAQVVLICLSCSSEVILELHLNKDTPFFSSLPISVRERGIQHSLGFFCIYGEFFFSSEDNFLLCCPSEFPFPSGN